MATFDRWQQTYCLALMSGAASNTTGDPASIASTLQGYLSAFYKANTPYLGTWSTVWGPVVFESDPGTGSYAANVMYVAANADKSVYVVSIAGTNANSTYDEDDEDEAVNTTVAWGSAFPSLQPYTTPAKLNPYLSTGTALGVNNLLGMVDTLQGTNQNIVAFLKSLQPPLGSAVVPTRDLIFSGHSLGGALAPTLGLALFSPTGGQLRSARWGSVYLYPTAGPTPGNADLATFLSNTFASVPAEAQPYQVWNQNVWNTIDIVPHAWLVSMLQEIPTIYPQATWKNPPVALTDQVNQMVKLSNEGEQDNNAGPYTPLSNQSLAGTFNSGIPVSDIDSFKAQALYQHTTAYQVLLGVTDITWEGSAGTANAGFVNEIVTGNAQGLATKATT